MPTSLMLVALLAFASLLSGCTHVVACNTPYFKNGPTQLEPPQGELKAGTWVALIGRRDSYARVLAPDGTNAYVLEQDLRSIWAPAPRTPKETTMKTIGPGTQQPLVQPAPHPAPPRKPAAPKPSPAAPAESKPPDAKPAKPPA